MYINLMKGAPKDDKTYGWLKDIQPKLCEIDSTLEKHGQWGLFYTHRIDENEDGDNILVYPVAIDGNQVVATLLDLVLDLCDRGQLKPKGNRVVGGLAIILEMLYSGKTTSEVRDLLGKVGALRETK